MSTINLATPMTLTMSSIVVLSLSVDTVNGLGRVTYQPLDQSGNPLGGPLTMALTATQLSGFMPVARAAVSRILQAALGFTVQQPARPAQPPPPPGTPPVGPAGPTSATGGSP